jgi:hypothetical protein
MFDRWMVMAKGKFHDDDCPKLGIADCRYEHRADGNFDAIYILTDGSAITHVINFLALAEDIENGKTSFKAAPLSEVVRMQ